MSTSSSVSVKVILCLKCRGRAFEVAITPESPKGCEILVRCIKCREGLSTTEILKATKEGLVPGFYDKVKN